MKTSIISKCYHLLGCFLIGSPEYLSKRTGIEIPKDFYFQSADRTLTREITNLVVMKRYIVDTFRRLLNPKVALWCGVFIFVFGFLFIDKLVPGAINGSKAVISKIERLGNPSKEKLYQEQKNIEKGEAHDKEQAIALSKRQKELEDKSNTGSITSEEMEEYRKNQQKLMSLGGAIKW